VDVMKYEPIEYEPIEGWIDWETRFSTCAPCKVWPGGKMKTPDGTPIEPILVNVEERRYAEGKWTNETVHVIRSEE